MQKLPVRENQSLKFKINKVHYQDQWINKTA